MSRISPPSVDELDQLFLHACEEYQNGRLESAGEAYRRLLCWCGNVPILHYNHGLVLYKQRDFEQARDAFARAAELSPDDPDILFNLALSHKKCGDPEAAIAVYSELLQYEPENVDALYNLAGSYRDNGQREEAKTTYRRLLRLAPDHPSANNNLAYLHHLDGELEEALACYRMVLTRVPDHAAAAHMVAALTGEDVAASPEEYVRKVFDHYAERFEQSLVADLAYQGPELLREFHDRAAGPARAQYAHGLDLGCGTGLAGAAFAERIAVFDGLDLSAKMLEVARDKHIYRNLYPGSIAEILTASRDSFDFYLAADVFNYVGDLEETFRLLRRRARPNAVLCCSTEAAPEGDYRLEQTGRFAHAADYVRRTAQATGWRVAAVEPARLRKEQDAWVAGELWLLIAECSREHEAGEELL